MSILELEQRLARLEAEVERLKQERSDTEKLKQPWWEQIRGGFKNDPAYIEAMRLGREWRTSQKSADEEVES